MFPLERVHEYYQKRLLERIYQNWKQALTNKLLMQQHEHRLAQLQERILLRWAFEQWKSRTHRFSHLKTVVSLELLSRYERSGGRGTLHAYG